MSAPLKPIYLDKDGVLAQLADGSIINIGGVAGPSFTVGGRGLLFDDGTSTSGGVTITLQSAYDNSNGQIKLSTGKDFIVADDTDDGLYFKVDAETGKVTITGDLEILGQSTKIDTVIQDSDHWLISPKSSATVALKIEPDAGVTPLVDLISVRRTFGATPVFRVDKDGNLIATQNLTVGGLINGVDVADLKATVEAHLTNPSHRHHATQIDIDPIENLAGASNVQEALEVLESRVGQGGGGTDPTPGSGVQGYEHVQVTATKTWIISHGKNTRRVTTALYDDDYQLIIPDTVKVMDLNTVAVMFGSAISGRAMLTLF